MDSNSAFDLLKEEMENEDIIIKVNAIHRLPIVMALMSPDKIVNDLLQYLLKIVPTEEDEVLLAVSEQIPKFKQFLDQNQLLGVLPLLQFLLCVEETVVRDQTVEGTREIIKLFNEEQTQKDLMNLITMISNQEYFTGKVSACYLIRMAYEKAGKEREKLRNLYYKLCDDETPLIKRTAAKEFGPLCLIMEKEIVNPEMINYFKKFMSDSDSVKVIALSSLIQLVKLFQNTDNQRLNVQVVVAASEDKSWRVRHELARIFPQLIDGFGSQINELVPTLGNLIKDTEMEVRNVALEGLAQIIRFFNTEKVSICIIPAILSVANDSTPHVKASIGECLGPIARSVGYNTFNTKMCTLFDSLMKDENAEVRLGISKSLYDIFISSEGSLLSSIGVLLGNLQKDTQYRIREKIYETLGKLGGLEQFKAHIDSAFFNFMNDNVASVREVGIKSLESIIVKFGPNWVTLVLIPKLQASLNQTKISYLLKMCILNCLAVCTKALNSNQIVEFILPHILKSLKDKVANVRFFTIKLLEITITNCDQSTKEKVKGAVKDLSNDEDLDVKYYSQRFTTTF